MRILLSPLCTHSCCVNTTVWRALWPNSTLTGTERDSTRRRAKSWAHTYRSEINYMKSTLALGLNVCSPVLQLTLLFVSQVITFRDYLPHIVGPDLVARQLSNYPGYDQNVDPSIANVFATAAYRFGHVMVQPFIFRLNNLYQDHPIFPSQLLHLTFFSSWRVVFEGHCQYFFNFSILP